MTKRPHATTKTTPSVPAITDETIAARAYVKWQLRGCPLWDQDQDWFTARNELERELASTGSASKEA